MKTKSKALLLALCAVSLVTASVLGTMAYLTSTDNVENTFTVGSVAITMDETDVDNSSPDKNRDQANSYKLLPGQTYTKDPIIHVDPKSEECFLFVKVENGIAAIEANDNTVASQMTKKGWKLVEGNVYVYVGTENGASAPVAVKANATIPVFEKIKIADSVSGTQLADYKGKTITVTAYAVHKAGFENMAAADIWNTAFPAA